MRLLEPLGHAPASSSCRSGLAAAVAPAPASSCILAPSSCFASPACSSAALAASAVICVFSSS